MSLGNRKQHRLSGLAAAIASIAAQSGFDIDSVELVEKQDDNCQCLGCAIKRHSFQPGSKVEDIANLADMSVCFSAIQQNAAVLAAEGKDAAKFEELAMLAEKLGYPAAAALIRDYSKVCVELQSFFRAAKEETTAKKEAFHATPAASEPAAPGAD